MYWFLGIIVIGFAFLNLSEARRPSAYVVGTVYCDTCFQDEFSRNSRFISGALVAVECRGRSSKFSFREEVKTNQDGKFKVHLPFSVTKHVKRIKSCSVELIRSSEPYCAVASTARSSSLHLKSRKPGANIFSAGFFTFKPLKQPTVCNQKPSVGNAISKQSPTSDDSTFDPPLRDPPKPLLGRNFLPTLPGLPNLPLLPPLPELPTLPLLPGLGHLPPNLKAAKSEDVLRTSEASNESTNPRQFFPPFPQFPPLFPATPPSSAIPFPQLPPLFPTAPPPSSTTPPNPFLLPNPFQSPPSVLPPNPFQAPPLVFPPNPFQPTPPIIRAPTNPGLSPSPPPPPLPPFPFQPYQSVPPPAYSPPTLKEASP